MKDTAEHRRLNDAKDKAEIESMAAEMIDRFGPLPDATANLVKLIEIKHQAIEACKTPRKGAHSNSAAAVEKIHANQ